MYLVGANPLGYEMRSISSANCAACTAKSKRIRNQQPLTSSFELNHLRGLSS